MTALSDEILRFWFGPGDDPYDVESTTKSRWFNGGDSFDEEIRQLYADHLERAIRGEYDEWAESPQGRMALILVLDQFSRNLFRGSPRSWSQDLLAQRLTLQGMELGHDKALRPIERIFFYLPLEHAEDLQLQELSVQAYQELADDAPDDTGFDSFLDYAVRHHEIIERFGRFPHRNKVIGRPTTEEEAAFLEEPNSSF